MRPVKKLLFFLGLALVLFFTFLLIGLAVGTILFIAFTIGALIVAFYTIKWLFYVFRKIPNHKNSSSFRITIKKIEKLEKK